MTSSTVIVDAGPLYAYVDADDAHHSRCAEFLANHNGTLIIPQLVITEVSHLLASRLGTRAELLFLSDIASGAFSTEPVHTTDWLRITELVAQYRNFPLGTVDASVIACTERLALDAVATLDRRHFAAVRPRHLDSLNLLP